MTQAEKIRREGAFALLQDCRVLRRPPGTSSCRGSVPPLQAQCRLTALRMRFFPGKGSPRQRLLSAVVIVAGGMLVAV